MYVAFLSLILPFGIIQSRRSVSESCADVQMDSELRVDKKAAAYRKGKIAQEVSPDGESFMGDTQLMKEGALRDSEEDVRKITNESHTIAKDVDVATQSIVANSTTSSATPTSTTTITISSQENMILSPMSSIRPRKRNGLGASATTSTSTASTTSTTSTTQLVGEDFKTEKEQPTKRWSPEDVDMLVNRQNFKLKDGEDELLLYFGIFYELKNSNFDSELREKINSLPKTEKWAEETAEDDKKTTRIPGGTSFSTTKPPSPDENPTKSGEEHEGGKRDLLPENITDVLKIQIDPLARRILMRGANNEEIQDYGHYVVSKIRGPEHVIRQLKDKPQTLRTIQVQREYWAKLTEEELYQSIEKENRRKQKKMRRSRRNVLGAVVAAMTLMSLGAVGILFVMFRYM